MIAGNLLLRTPCPIWDLHMHGLLVETNTFPELFPDYAIRTSLGTFSNLLAPRFASIQQYFELFENLDVIKDIPQCSWFYKLSLSFSFVVTIFCKGRLILWYKNAISPSLYLNQTDLTTSVSCYSMPNIQWSFKNRYSRRNTQKREQRVLCAKENKIKRKRWWSQDVTLPTCLSDNNGNAVISKNVRSELMQSICGVDEKPIRN